MAAKTKYLYLWNRDIYNRNFKTKARVFDHAKLEETVPERLRQRSKPEMAGTLHCIP